ncbi:hypothetical protein Tco_0169931 [Tanacetum coccineum]
MLGLKRLHGFLEVTTAQRLVISLFVQDYCFIHNTSRFGINKWYQSIALRNFDIEDIELESTNSGPTTKLPILKLGLYEMWIIRIKQYFQIQDYALWEESLDSIFNRLQKIVSRLAILVSTASPNVNAASPQVSTANVSDNTVCLAWVLNLDAIVESMCYVSCAYRPVWGCEVGNQKQGYRNQVVILGWDITMQIMADSAIIISSDSSDESVGSPPSRVILFGDIPTVIPSTSVVAPETSTIAPVISSAAPVVETTLVASPTGLCGLVPYTGSDSDTPDEMTSPEHISPTPAISPFICTDSSEAPDSSDGPPSQDPYVATVARWRSRVTARPSSSHEFPIAPVTAPPGIRRRSATLIRPGEAIPFGRPYRTHPNGPRKLLTARKRVRPLPARRLASRHASPRSPDHHSSSSSSSSDSSPVHSLGLDAPDQAHSGSSTRDVSPRLRYPPRRAPRRRDSSERPMHSSPHSAGPSRKRCRSPVDSVPLSMPVTGSLAPTRADHLPPRKRFRDSYSSEASIEEDAEVGDHVGIDHRDARVDTEEYEADASTGGTAEAGIDPMTAPLVEEEIVEPAGEDSPDLPVTRDGIDRIVGIETAQGRLEADQLIASGDRARMAEAIYSLRLENLKIRAMLDIERDRVSSLRLHMSLSQEEFRQVRRDRDDARGRLRRNVGIEIVQRRLEADQLIARGQRISMIQRIDSLRLENLKVRAMLDIERDRVNSLRLHISLSHEEFCQVERESHDTTPRET